MRIMLSLAATAAVALMATAANATTFVGHWTVDGYDNDNNINNGFVIETTPDSSNLNFSLTAGNSTNINLFKIYTNEDNVDNDDKIGNAKPITVKFTFTSPTGQSGDDTADGITYAVDGTINNGVVHWTDPANLTFGNGNQLTITLSDETFNEDDHSNDLNDGSNHGATVHATFAMTQAAVAGVPEPASWALMIGGFGMSGAMLRRRRTAVLAA